MLDQCDKLKDYSSKSRLMIGTHHTCVQHTPVPQRNILPNRLFTGMYGIPPKTNMEPENGGFQKESPFPGVPFSGSMLIFLGVYLFISQQATCGCPWHAAW